MASLFKPSYTRPIPPNVTRLKIRGRPAVRWRGRNGKDRTAFVCASDPSRCLVESDSWWIEYTDAGGQTQRVRASPDRAVSERLLADLTTRVEQQKHGMVPTSSMRADTPLAELAVEYRDYLVTIDCTAEHSATVYARVSAIIAACEFSRFAHLEPDRISRYLSDRRKAGLSDRRKAGLSDRCKAGLSVNTTNGYTAAIKSFSRWLATRFHSADPLARLRRLPAADPVRPRRILTDDELAKLLAMTRADVRTALRRDLFTGPQRWALYLTAAYTGLRASELASLHPESFDAESRTVEIQGAYAKDGKTDTIPLPREVAALLLPWVASRPPGVRLWPGSWADGKEGSVILRRDLERAGIAYRTEEGTADFHALRSYYITSLARAGVHPAKAQRLARHKDIRLTMQVYTKLGLHDLTPEVDRLKGPVEPKIEAG